MRPARTGFATTETRFQVPSPKKKTYKVIGVAEVDGHAPGETFEAALDEEREEFLVSMGAIEETASPAKKD